MNDRVPRLFQPSFRLYFVLLLIFAVSTFFIGEHFRILAGVQLVVLIVLAVYYRMSSRSRTKKLLEYLESITEGRDTTVQDTPLPVMVYNPESNEILWANDRFKAAAKQDSFYEKRLTDIVRGFSGDWLLDGKHLCPDTVTVGGCMYKVFGSIAKTEREYIATTYWVDVTDYEKTSEEYKASRLVFAVLMMDNYEELLRGMREKEKSILLSDIDEIISAWAGDKGGYLCKFERDRYFFVFEERNLQGFIDDNFSVLDIVRKMVGTDGVRATLSIGIGKDGADPQESYRFASLGVEMARSRGGDQAVIRNKFGFEFFGGHSQQIEKRTKVKSRIMASAFWELLGDASSVFVMGHAMADYDTIGAAVGICCIARAKGIPARIIINAEVNDANELIAAMSSLPEYKNTFISQQEAMLEADSTSLLTVVDTSRTDRVESKSLLLSFNRIAVIDHHRRSADYIDNAIFNFHEPSASSASELVTEMIQYLVNGQDIMKEEAEALMTGIVLDTKAFSVNSGSGTFDAAAFLRRTGADSATVKRFLQTDIETAAARYELMRGVIIYRDGVALASTDKPQSRISIAQAADELLNIIGVHTSFAAAVYGDDVLVSGRSIGDVNVQVILEKLGGGGSRSTAGLQMRGVDLGYVVDELKNAIDGYFAEDSLRHAINRR